MIVIISLAMIIGFLGAIKELNSKPVAKFPQTTNLFDYIFDTKY